MALGDLMASRFSQSVSLVSSHLDQCSVNEEEVEERNGGDLEGAAVSSGFGDRSSVGTVTSMAYLPQTSVLCDGRHEVFEVSVPASNTGLVSKWRPKDRVSWFGWFCVNCLLSCVFCCFGWIGNDSGLFQ